MTELEKALNALSRSTEEFLATMEGVTAAQYLAAPAPGRWCLADNAEHTTVVIRGVERLLTTRLLQQPLAADDPARRVRDADLAAFLADRALAIDAPEMVRPRGRWTTRGDMAAVLGASTDGLINWARATNANLRDFGAPHPLLGQLDGMQWIRFLALHTDRHAKQAEEIRGLNYGGAVER
jgi:hypothetical protein